MASTGNSNQILGGSPIGQISLGQFANNTNYLLCDGSDNVAASYPLLDKTGLLTYGSNAWASATLPTSQIWSAAVMGGSVTVAVSSTTGTAAARSTDGGATWTATTIPSGSYSAVDWNGTLFVAVGTNVCATSPDGTTWTARSIGSGAWCTIKSRGSFWIALSSAATNSYVSSVDATTWTARTLPVAYQWAALSDINGQFWAIPAYDGTSSAIGAYLVSDDGLTNWFYKSLPTSSTRWTAAVQLNSKIYIGQSPGAAPYVSTDGGSSWAQLAGAAPMYGVYGINGYLMAPLYTGAGNAVATSIDGFLFKQKALPSALGLGFMCQTNVGALILPSASSAACATLALDATKFRTPRSTRGSDSDRPYIRAK